MAITDDLAKLSAPVAEPQDSWVKDLIDKRFQPQQDRIKRTPVGFNFTREPFDPSSYYKQIGTLRDISHSATTVTQQETANKEAAARKAEEALNQQKMMDALKGVNPDFTYSNGSATTNGVSKKYGLKGVTPNASKAADYFGSKYGIATIGGRGPGSVPGSDHPAGRALDFMINNIKNGKAQGDALANDAIQNYKAWNIKYVIWNRYIWTPSQGWHKYVGPSDHTDHVHVSFNS